MKVFCVFVLMFVSSFVHGQNVVKWTFNAKKIADETYELHLKAKIDEPWHIYAQNTPKGGPLATKFNFAKNPLIVLQGKVKEKGDIEMYHDNIFDVDVYAYGDTVEFVQAIVLKAKAKTTISGTVEFMACTKEQCLTPQTVKFSVKLE